MFLGCCFLVVDGPLPGNLLRQPAVLIVKEISCISHLQSRRSSCCLLMESSEELLLYFPNCGQDVGVEEACVRPRWRNKCASETEAANNVLLSRERLASIVK